MHFKNKATKIKLLDLKTPPMRAFHITWLAFFLCFFGWFGIAPLMSVVRDDLQLTKEQIGNTVIAAVLITVFARLVIGLLLDRFGPRRVYTCLLILGALPVMAIGLSQNYTQFLLFRLAIGAIGASFVITQYHTSIMFAPNIVGTANATSAGWGNLGGGVTNIVMPLILTAVMGITGTAALGWRIAMIIPGIALLIAGIGYYFLTQDAPNGNFAELRTHGEMPSKETTQRAMREVLTDPRVWLLALAYAASFGIELTMDNVAALYFADYFKLGVVGAGIVAGMFGLMNIFARSLGGILSDRFSRKSGLQGRVLFLGIVLLSEGVTLVLFSRMAVLALAIPMLLIMGLAVKLSNGANYSIVPFVNRPALGLVAGIVGAGGNVGAVLAGFLFRGALPWNSVFLILGGVVVLIALSVPLVRFTAEQENAVNTEIAYRLAAVEAAAALD